MQNFNKTETMYLAKPILILAVVILLVVVTIIFGLNQITAQITKIEDSKAVENSLNQKVFVLQKVSEVIKDDTTFLDVVIPSKAASLYGLSQIKNQAARNNLLLTNVRTSGAVPLEGGISKISVSFDVEGKMFTIYEFLKSFKQSLPLMSVDKVKVSTIDPIARALVTLNVYSAELPRTIPSVSATVEDFTPEEIGIIRNLSTYNLPVFIEPKATDIIPKEDPFN